MKKLMVVFLLTALPVVALADEKTPTEPPHADAASVETVNGDAESGDEGWTPPKLTARFGGRLQLDYAWFDDDLVVRGSGGEVRRARLFASGTIGDNWDYKVQLGFAGGDSELKDGYVRYSGLGSGRLIIGNFKQPNSLDVLTSSKYTTFMERGLITGISEGRRMGVGYHYASSKHTVMASVYGDEANGEAEGSGAAGRFTWNPMKSDDSVVHLGLSLGYSDPSSDTLRLRVRPEAHKTGDRILDTGAIENVDNVVRAGVEGAVVKKRFSAQAEYIQGDVSRNGVPDVSFDGWYVYGSWFLTPDSRNYSGKDGAFKGTTPSQPGGAWEVALRYSTMDLTDEDITGGSVEAVTLGLNWYANKYLRFSANYSAVDSDDVAGNDDPNVFQVRMQVVF